MIVCKLEQILNVAFNEVTLLEFENVIEFSLLQLLNIESNKADVLFKFITGILVKFLHVLNIFWNAVEPLAAPVNSSVTSVNE